MKKIICMVAFALICNVNAGFKQGKIIYRCDFSKESVRNDDLRPGSIMWDANGGEKGDALHFKSTDNRGTPNYSIDLPVEMCAGKILMLEVRAKGINLEQGESRKFAPNYMLRVERKNAQKIRWAKVDSELGTYDWKTFCRFERIPADVRSVKIVLVLQNCKGEAWIDHVTVSEAAEVADDGPAPANLEAAKIRRGPYADPAKDRSNGKRGFMSGNDMSEEAVAQLARWGANLVRLQMRPQKGQDISTPELYLQWIDTAIRQAEADRERCQRHGISLVLDLHAAPGGVKSKHASNMLTSDTRFDVLYKAWEKIATAFKGKPGIYAYDLLNEPSVNRSVWIDVTKNLIKTIRKVDPATAIVIESVQHYYTEDTNLLYGGHFYQPHDLTHQGVGRFMEWKYPGYINGTYWDKEQLRLALKETIDFQQKHNAKIYIGEFSCIMFANGCEQWVKDAVELFDEYGFDYTYHAFREWQPWSVELEPAADWKTAKVKWRTSADNGRKRALLESFKRNKSFSRIDVPQAGKDYSKLETSDSGNAVNHKAQKPFILFRIKNILKLFSGCPCPCTDCDSQKDFSTNRFATGTSHE